MGNRHRMVLHQGNQLLYRDLRPQSAIYGIHNINLTIRVYSGKEYGTASIEIHLKSCKQKWDMEESKKPLRNRRPLPEPPKNFDEVSWIWHMIL